MIVKTHECGNLVSYEDKENNIYNKYYYNQNNYRIRKEIYNQNGQLTDVIYFFYDLNNKLIGQKSNSVTLIFLYDELDQLNGFIYNGEKYYYLIDALGIIKGIIDANGNLKVEYSYDTWGRKITDNIVKLGKINPFRYKCYYYDDETQLYWVSSRYYSPELCRWISPDSIEYLDPQSINGLNLYCYCGNNPVM